MNSSEFSEWAKLHAALFRFGNEQDVLMVSLWESTLAPYTFEECKAASIWLNLQPNVFPSHHVRMLAARMSSLRFAQENTHRNEMEEGVDGWKLCGTCGYSGYAIVPHLKCVRDGHWAHPFAEVAVICDCAKGGRMQNFQDRRLAEKPDGARGFTLAEYGRLNPGWIVQMEERKAQQKALNRADTLAEGADKRHGKFSAASLVAEVLETKCPSPIRC